MAERSNRFNATQEAVQETALRVSQQQLLDAQLLELGDDDLLQRVEDELNENGALEEGRDEEDDEFPSDDPSDLSDKEREEDLSYYYDDEELPVYTPGGGDNEQAEIPVGDTRSFVDDLRAQVPEHGIADEKQAELVDYLIGSLNDTDRSPAFPTTSFSTTISMRRWRKSNRHSIFCNGSIHRESVRATCRNV